MFFAAFATVILTFAALLALIRTLLHTGSAAKSAKRMVREAKKTTKAALATVDATREMAKDSRDIGNQQLRAYVEVGDARITGDTFDFRMVIPLQNFGQNPARDFRFKYHIDYGNVPIPDFTDMPWKPVGGIPLAPGHSYNIIYEKIDMTKAASQRHADGQIYNIVGIAEYFDIGGSRRETRFSLRVDLRGAMTDRPAISPENEGNYST